MHAHVLPCTVICLAARAPACLPACRPASLPATPRGAATRCLPSMQGYVDAARVFERESGTAPGVDLDLITDRMDIRKAVQSGDVEQVRRRGGAGQEWGAVGSAGHFDCLPAQQTAAHPS